MFTLSTCRVIIYYKLLKIFLGEQELTKKNNHHEDLKNELIEKGLKILNKEGYEGFSLRKAARACGVSQTAPYRHFKDKDALVEAIKMRALREFNLPNGQDQSNRCDAP
jgi:AcrR family transcriptional regulator